MQTIDNTQAQLMGQVERMLAYARSLAPREQNDYIENVIMEVLMEVESIAFFDNAIDRMLAM